MEPGERTKYTVTISRQLGSQGTEIARRAAEILGYRLVWREVINQAARRAGAPEAALAMIDDLGLLGICPSPKGCQAYRLAVQQVMHELAETGAIVIVGRAGQVILRDQPYVLHVRIMAPNEVRVQRIAAQQEISQECALAQVEASDQSHRKYMKRFYQVRWDDPELYDLTINTARASLEEAAQLVCAALRLRQNRTSPETPPQQETVLEHSRQS